MDPLSFNPLPIDRPIAIRRPPHQNANGVGTTDNPAATRIRANGDTGGIAPITIGGGGSATPATIEENGGIAPVTVGSTGNTVASVAIGEAGGGSAAPAAIEENGSIAPVTVGSGGAVASANRTDAFLKLRDITQPKRGVAR